MYLVLSIDLVSVTFYTIPTSISFFREKVFKILVELTIPDKILIKLINLTLYANFCCCMSSRAFLLYSEKLAARQNSHSELYVVQ